jgi:tRNA(adenine34) deaminase
MNLALVEAEKAGQEGNHAVGSVIVRQEEVVSRGRNLVASTVDPTAHAEIVALREAAARTRSPDLAEYTLYTTFEPCPMCCSAILLSNITHLVMGARGPGSAPLGQYSVEKLLSLTDRTASINVTDGVLASECLEVRKKWEGSSRWLLERLSAQ